MKRGNVLVEQIQNDGIITADYDVSLSPSEIGTVLCRYFPNLKKVDGTPVFYVGKYHNHKYAIRCKNITYLGIPHPIYKKRIQIADDLMAFYDVAVKMGAKPLLLGVYTYGEHTVFVDFKMDTYLGKKAHNSSAHVYAEDLWAATVDGYFQKVDCFGNTITAFRPDVIPVFLDELFESGTVEDVTADVPEVAQGAVNQLIQSVAPQNTQSRGLQCIQSVAPQEDFFRTQIAPVFRDFFQGLPKVWHGITCYEEMIAAEYKNKFQPEWVGFYLEFCFEKYLKENHLEDKIVYYQDKKEGGIDLDLYFPQIACFGDLKAHSEDSKGIQGNDWETVFSILNREGEAAHLYYIVCEHETKKDSEYDYEVTKFWNMKQNKADLFSYHKRMKNNVTLKKAYLLDINPANKEYLSMFKQGINSNGKPRPPKIMIDHENLGRFVVEEIIIS